MPRSLRCTLVVLVGCAPAATAHRPEAAPESQPETSAGPPGADAAADAPPGADRFDLLPPQGERDAGTGGRDAAPAARSDVGEEAAAAGLQRLMVSLASGRLRLTDIDRGHELVRDVAVRAGDYKGIAVHVASDRLYITSRAGNRLHAYRLSSLSAAAAELVYDRAIACPYPDSLVVTPDGRELYVPCRDAGKAVVLDAASTAVLAEIDMSEPFVKMTVDQRTRSSPHNAFMGKGRAYLAALANPMVFVVDLATRKLATRVGPFSQSIRPFTVAAAEDRVYVNIDGTLGFGIGDLGTGRVIAEVSDRRPAGRTAGNAGTYHLTPSHGIALRPGTTEVWFTNDAWGYLHVWDVGITPPRKLADAALFDTPTQRVEGNGWVTFDIDGRFAFSASGAVVDAGTKQKVAQIAATEFRIAVTFRDGKPVQAGRRMF